MFGSGPPGYNARSLREEIAIGTRQTTSRARARILATAYACRPGSGSEDGNGWWLADQLRRFGDVWVLTPSNNRAAIESAAIESAANEAPQRGFVKFVYVDVPRWPADSTAANRWRRTHYNLWQLRILRTARRLHAEIGFDVVHHLTYGQYWSGTWIGRLGPPFVWGPVGGGESAPADLVAALPEAGQRYERHRDMARTVGRRTLPVARAARAATLVLAATDETKRAVEALRVARVEVMPTAALPDADYEALAAIRASAPQSGLRIMCVGRLEYWKGFHLAVEAFASFVAKAPDSELWIVGAGPAEGHLRELVRAHGLEDKVSLLGRLPRSEVLERLARSHVLAHPSLHDSAGWATLEAAAAGLPVVCLDLGGPALQVTPETGVKIPVDDTSAIVPAIAEAFAALAADPAHARALGAAGRARVGAHFTWDRLGDRLATLEPYRSVIQGEHVANSL
jgi:glycosyltransferase involved in cell wall biosynthesis